eukprot:Skav206191  [mRNA]  locus=scaffold1844:172956:175884:- [translate_table: standard]
MERRGPPVRKTVEKKKLRLKRPPPPPIIAEINELAKTWKSRLSPWKKKSSGSFSLGSDCAGYGSEMLALRLLGLQKRVHLTMVSEKSDAKLALHTKMASMCGINDRKCSVFRDMTTRENDKAPRVDLYCGGFPCPTFSRMGKKQGTEEERGMVTLHGVHDIASTRPRAASSLSRYLGIPQSRPRVYLLAVSQETVAHPLVMPERRASHPDLHTFLDKTSVGTEVLKLPKYEQQLGPKLWSYGYIVDVAASLRYQHALTNCCPCLTKTRCQQHGYYIPKLRRRLSVDEMSRLQGLPSTVTAGLREVADASGSRWVEEGVGDGMSINVLQTMLRRLLDSAGLTSLGESKDFWLQWECATLRWTAGAPSLERKTLSLPGSVPVPERMPEAKAAPAAKAAPRSPSRSPGGRRRAPRAASVSREREDREAKRAPTPAKRAAAPADPPTKAPSARTAAKTTSAKSAPAKPKQDDDEEESYENVPVESEESEEESTEEDPTPEKKKKDLKDKAVEKKPPAKAQKAAPVTAAPSAPAHSSKDNQEALALMANMYESQAAVMRSLAKR